VVIPATLNGLAVAAIGGSAFASDLSLTSVTIPATVTSIGSHAFQGCANLISAIFLGHAPAMGAAVFDLTAPGFTAYYYECRTGFSSPTWQGYPAVKLGDASPLEAWLRGNGLPYDTNLQADSDGDGVNLLMAYALNLNPKQNLSGSMPRPVLIGNQMSITFYAASAEVTYAVESSTDLQTWTSEGVTISAPDANKLRTATVPMNGPCRFMRLGVAEAATLSPLATWLRSNGLPYDANLQADPNGDGVNVLLAYALDLNPKQNLSGSMPRPVLVGNQMSLTFHAGSAGVTYTVESSTDLQTWSSDDVTIVEDSEDRNYRTATVTRTGPARFIRLVVGY
jgi:hypothetical protein